MIPMIVSSTDPASFTIQTKNTGDAALLWSQAVVLEKGINNKSIDAILCSVQSGGSDTEQLPAIVIRNPGEYEFKGIFVVGEACVTFQNEFGVFYAIDSEGVRILAVPGSIEEKLTQEHFARIGSVDIVLTSVNANSIAIVADIISQAEPRAVITNDGAPTAAFIKKIGLQAERVSKLKIMKKDLPQEHTACYILTKD